jgi:Transglycosylase SLT domain
MSVTGGSRRRPAGPTRNERRLRLGLVVVLVGIVVAAVLSALGVGPLPKPPPAIPARPAGAGDPFGYVAAREADYVARAAAGNSHVLYVKSPGGVMATASRVAAYRGLIDRVTAGTGIDPNLLEGLVFVESAGRPQIIAGSDPADAAGLTQILAQTGQQLLGMRINLAKSRKLTNQINAVAAGTRNGTLGPLLARRATADPRFSPAAELAATVHYLRLAEARFGRQDLAIESYHMGIGNLQQVLGAYDGGRSVPYTELYFDSAPDHHAAAYRLLSGFGDDSWLYYWRVLGAVEIMHLYRTDRPALEHLSALQNQDDAGAAVLHPPSGPSFSDPSALASAYQSRALVPLPSNATALGLAYKPGMGSGAKSQRVPRTLYVGLRPVAVRLLIELAARVRALSGGKQPLWVYSTVMDKQYQSKTGQGFLAQTTGWGFQIARRYVSVAQAAAFQAMLDRLQSLNLIAWAREPTAIDITVAPDAGDTAGHGL